MPRGVVRPSPPDDLNPCLSTHLVQIVEGPVTSLPEKVDTGTLLAWGSQFSHRATLKMFLRRSLYIGLIFPVRH